MRLFYVYYSLPKNNGLSCQTRPSVRQGTEFNCIYIYIYIYILIQTIAN